MPDLSDGLEPFDPYVNASTVAQRWQVWVRRARNFLLAKGITDPSRQRAMFLYKAGRHVEELYYQLSPEDPQLPSRPPDDVASEDHDAYAAALASYEIAMANLFESAVKLLSDHFNPQRNSMHEREIFFSLKLENNETIGSFVQRLQAQAEHCYFISEMQQEMIRDRLYACCPWPDLKLSMLKAAVAAPTNTPFSLETALTMATAFEKLLPVEAPVSIVTDVNHRTFTDGNCLTISSVCGVMASIIGLLFRCGMKHLGGSNGEEEAEQSSDDSESHKVRSNVRRKLFRLFLMLIARPDQSFN